MERYRIERRGGFAGLKAQGTVDASSLAKDDRAVMEDLFTRSDPLPAAQGADRFVYKVTRESEAGSTSREIPETLLPRAVARAVKESL